MSRKSKQVLLNLGIVPIWEIILFKTESIFSQCSWFRISWFSTHEGGRVKHGEIREKKVWPIRAGSSDPLILLTDGTRNPLHAQHLSTLDIFSRPVGLVKFFFESRFLNTRAGKTLGRINGVSIFNIHHEKEEGTMVFLRRAENRTIYCMIVSFSSNNS